MSASSTPARVAAVPNQTGKGALGCSLVLLLAATFAYVSFKVIPVYIDKMNFEEDLAREASRAGANLWTDEKIKEDVLAVAQFRSFRLGQEDITIERSRAASGEVRLMVKYTAPVAFPGYTHVFEFESKSTSIVGSF